MRLGLKREGGEIGQQRSDAPPSHGAYRLVAAYNRGLLDRRTHLGQLAGELEAAYAEHAGFTSLAGAPVTLREKVRLAVGAHLFQLAFVPGPDTKTGGRELRSSELLLNRITTELGLTRPVKTVTTLSEYLAESADGEDAA